MERVGESHFPPRTPAHLRCSPNTPVPIHQSDEEDGFGNGDGEVGGTTNPEFLDRLFPSRTVLPVSLRSEVTPVYRWRLTPTRCPTNHVNSLL